MKKPGLLVFASGKAHGGGSGAEKLVHATQTGVLDAKVIGFVSNREHGGVRDRAKRLSVPFIHFRKPWSEVGYRTIAMESGADFFALAGWLKPVVGLNPCFTFNPHPGPLPTFGGVGMYDRYVHEAVINAFHNKVITHSALCVHFVTPPPYDRGPIILRQRVPIYDNDTPESLGKRMKMYEHLLFPEVVNLILHREITWDGRDPKSLKLPSGYNIYREAL